MKNTILTSVALGGALLLSACGSSSKEDRISEKAGILIYQNAAPGVCNSDDFRVIVYNAGYRDFITQETNSNTTCATYGKRNDGTSCGESYLGSGNVNCVIGFNNYVGVTSTDNVSMYENFEILESSLQ